MNDKFRGPGALALLMASGNKAQLEDMANVNDFPSLVLSGDSITNANGSFNNPNNYWDSDGYMFWAQLRAKGRFKILAQTGIGGNTSTELLARIQADVLDYKSNYVLALIGTNDIAVGDTAEVTIANLQEIYDQIKANGSYNIICTLTPRSSHDTTERRVKLAQINQFIRDYADSDPTVILVDWFGAVVGFDGYNWASGLSDDGVHPNAYGAFLMGEYLYNVLNARLGFTENDNLSRALDDTNNLLTNGLFIGGTTIATGWLAGLGTLSKNEYTDPITGEKYNEQLVEGSNTTVSFRQEIAVEDIEVGRKVEAMARLRIVGGATFDKLRVSIKATGTANLGYSLNSNADETLLMDGIYTAPPMDVPEGATKFEFWFVYSNLNGQIAASNATLRYVD